MSGIKYYQLTKGEELPDEFCAVRDIDGEPSEYTFYVPEAENAKLRELVRDYHRFADATCAERDCDGCSQRDEGACERGVLTSRECVLGVEVD